MAWRKTYSDTHFYNEYVTQAEEASFLDDYKHPMIQLDPQKTILVICHSDNTVDKFKMRQENTSQQIRKELRMRESPLDLRQMVKHPLIRQFYLQLGKI
jgi:hypothetical protein